MASSELVPYTEARRDRLEEELAAEANKRELTEDRRHGLVIRTYWLKLTNEISLQLTDESNGEVLEAIVPNNRVLWSREHPYPALGDQGIYPGNLTEGNYEDGA